MAESRLEGERVVPTSREIDPEAKRTGLWRDLLGSSMEAQPPPPPPQGATSWPEAVAAKIKEGQRKVRRLELSTAEVDREIEALEEVVRGMEVEMDYEVSLIAHCGDLEMMRRARQHCRPRAPLSDAEERALRDIRDLAASAIADYAANVAPVPAYDRIVNPFSDLICLPLPRPMAELSASRQRLVQEGK